MTDSPAPNWTLNSELCKIAEVDDIEGALQKMGLITRSEAPFEIFDSGEEWTRGGAETYLYRFRIEEKGLPSLTAIIKACVAFAPGQELDAILQSWTERRAMLVKAGVATPRLFAWGHGVVVEEFIPHELSSILAEHQAGKLPILYQLANYAAALSKLGFAAVSPFSDLRSRGSDVVVVDFGQDLGPPGVLNPPNPAMFELLEDYVRSTAIDVPAELWIDLRGHFAAMGGEFVH